MDRYTPSLLGTNTVQQIIGAGCLSSLLGRCSHLWVQRLGQRLNGAQAAQARGSPEALTSAAVEVMVLQQCSRVLGENCEKYADLLERVGFTLGNDLEKISDALLESLDRLQVFADAVARLKEVAETLPPRISCRASPEGYPSDFD
eukprot:symbB.v1.2.032542.t1/scaffold3919.1/size48322/4